MRWYENIFNYDYRFWSVINCSVDYLITLIESDMSKNYLEQSNQSLSYQATYWYKLPTPNRISLDFLFETDEEKAVKEFEKFVDLIEKKKGKEKETEDA